LHLFIGNKTSVLWQGYWTVYPQEFPIKAPPLVKWLVVADKPPVTDRSILCDGRCLLDDYHEVQQKYWLKKVCICPG
jgi:hypothetical protein